MKKSTVGFTIVELLIVVVVIAILAAITIVSYAGIQNKAKASAAQSAARQVVTKINLYLVENSDAYPNDLADIGFTSSQDTTYNYLVNNGANPKTFCTTVTVGNKSYYVSHSNQTPTEGACLGHGSGGVATIKNLASDPRATNISTGIANNAIGWNTTRWFGGTGSAGSYTSVNNASDGPAGLTSYIRKTWSSPPPSPTASGDTGFDTVKGLTNDKFAITPGKTINISCYLRASVPRPYRISVYQYTSAADNSNNRAYGPTSNGAANTWTRPSFAYTPPAGITHIRIACDSDHVNASTTNYVAGSTLDGTGLMVTEGETLHPYADGASPGWTWLGTPNASQSSGPAL